MVTTPAYFNLISLFTLINLQKAPKSVDHEGISIWLNAKTTKTELHVGLWNVHVSSRNAHVQFATHPATHLYSAILAAGVLYSQKFAKTACNKVIGQWIIVQQGLHCNSVKCVLLNYNREYSPWFLNGFAEILNKISCCMQLLSELLHDPHV